MAISSTTKISETGFYLNNLLVYSGVFFSIFWVWNRFTWYATLFDNNDIPFRLSFLLSIFCVIGLSASIEEILANNYNHFTFYYLTVECILLYSWSRVWRKSQHKILAKYFFISYSIGTLLIALSLLVEGKTKLIFWLLAILSEAIGPIVAWYRMQSQIPVHTSHIIERHGLFTIILLGEGVVAIGHNMSFPLSNDTFIPLTIAFGIIIALWWIYFDCGFGFSTNLSHDMLKTFIFGYGQFFVFLALSAIVTSLEYGLHFALNPEHMESESIAVRLNKELHQRLSDLATQTGRSKSFYVKRALAQYMEDMEDTYLAIDRIENSEGRVSMEEAKRILDVDS